MAGGREAHGLIPFLPRDSGKGDRPAQQGGEGAPASTQRMRRNFAPAWQLFLLRQRSGKSEAPSTAQGRGPPPPLPRGRMSAIVLATRRRVRVMKMVSGEWCETLFAIRYSPFAFLPPSMIFVRLGRRWHRLSSRSCPLRSLDGAKRNPGTKVQLGCRSRITLRSIRATRKKEAERRKTLSIILRNLRCGAREASRARLPAFHHGSCQRDSRIPLGSARARLPGDTAPLSGGLPPPAPAPFTAMHLARRS